MVSNIWLLILIYTNRTNWADMIDVRCSGLCCNRSPNRNLLQSTIASTLCDLHHKLKAGFFAILTIILMTAVDFVRDDLIDATGRRRQVLSYGLGLGFVAGK
jgi:hypothetical protein